MSARTPRSTSNERSSKKNKISSSFEKPIVIVRNDRGDAVWSIENILDSGFKSQSQISNIIINKPIPNKGPMSKKGTASSTSTETGQIFRGLAEYVSDDAIEIFVYKTVYDTRGFYTEFNSNEAVIELKNILFDNISDKNKELAGLTNKEETSIFIVPMAISVQNFPRGATPINLFLPSQQFYKESLPLIKNKIIVTTQLNGGKKNKKKTQRNIKNIRKKIIKKNRKKTRKNI